jgi:hypothetical protein
MPITELRQNHATALRKTIRPWLPYALVLCLLGSMLGVLQAQELRVESTSTHLSNGVLMLDARIHYSLSNKALEALYNGVPLTLELDIRVLRQRRYLWDEEVARLRQRYRLRYHPLTEQYLVKNLNTDNQQSYETLEAALGALGHIEDFPMLDKRLLDSNERYTAQLRVGLDIESLPAPLRPLAYLSPSWRLSSDWYSWPLEF